MMKVPNELNTWDYHDFPKCPEWFSDYLVELQKKSGTHLLKAVREEEKEEWGKIGGVECLRCGHSWEPEKENLEKCPECESERWNIEETTIFLRYVSWNHEDYLEYLHGRSSWKRVDWEFFESVIGEEDEFELVRGKTKAIEEEHGKGFVSRLRRGKHFGLKVEL